MGKPRTKESTGTPKRGRTSSRIKEIVGILWTAQGENKEDITRHQSREGPVAPKITKKKKKKKMTSELRDLGKIENPIRKKNQKEKPKGNDKHAKQNNEQKKNKPKEVNRNNNATITPGTTPRWIQY